ncbi:MAG: hypothetical protein LH479_14720 [Polaromonas sp.]|nr:hypothetical protein [Polaromonas sp.]
MWALIAFVTYLASKNNICGQTSGRLSFTELKFSFVSLRDTRNTAIRLPKYVFDNATLGTLCISLASLRRPIAGRRGLCSASLKQCFHPHTDKTQVLRIARSAAAKCKVCQQKIHT